jgi:hypothetical protein
LRLFTLDEANELLPRIRPLLEALRTIVDELSPLETRITEQEWRVRGNGRRVETGLYRQAQRLRERAAGQVGELQQLGVELKDPRTGLIDFPSQREGRVVYLCWMLDEPAVEFWHPLDTGFAGRRPL